MKDKAADWIHKRFCCWHEIGGTLREVRSEQGVLLRYECTICGKSFAIGQMYLEPLLDDITHPDAILGGKRMNGVM